MKEIFEGDQAGDHVGDTQRRKKNRQTQKQGQDQKQKTKKKHLKIYKQLSNMNRSHKKGRLIFVLQNSRQINERKKVLFFHIGYLFI